MGRRNAKPETRNPKLLSVLLLLLLLVSFLQVPAGFIHRALSVVVGLYGLPIFVGGAFALARDVKNLAELDVTPDLSPPRIAISVQSFPISIRGLLIVALLKEDFSNSIVRE